MAHRPFLFNTRRWCWAPRQKYTVPIFDENSKIFMYINNMSNDEEQKLHSHKIHMQPANNLIDVSNQTTHFLNVYIPMQPYIKNDSENKENMWHESNIIMETNCNLLFFSITFSVLTNFTANTDARSLYQRYMFHRVVRRWARFLIWVFLFIYIENQSVWQESTKTTHVCKMAHLLIDLDFQNIFFVHWMCENHICFCIFEDIFTWNLSNQEQGFANWF